MPDEAERLALAAELETHIDALNEYCDQVPPPERAEHINEFIAVFGEYDQATERLLSYYRRALEHAHRSVAVPTLEQAILAKMSPAELLAHREKDPVYRLGYGRGYCAAQQQYERLSSLYAQYAIIVPPASYTPSPLVARVQRFLSTRLMTGQRLPIEARKSLFFNTPATPYTDG
jgi:hypothetical protein